MFEKYFLRAQIVFCFFAIILIFAPSITNNDKEVAINEPVTKQNACVKDELSLNKLETNIVCGEVTEL